jgi:hypothetical protein
VRPLLLSCPICESRFRRFRRAVPERRDRGVCPAEDPSVTDPEQRLARFGQRDHVRVYGRDFEDRLREAGFDVEIVMYRHAIAPRDRVRLGLNYNLDAELGNGFNERPEPWEIWRVSKLSR